MSMSILLWVAIIMIVILCIYCGLLNKRVDYLEKNYTKVLHILSTHNSILDILFDEYLESIKKGVNFNEEKEEE